jgi:multisubunit Na+/H+ antiporter MnhG subunit
VCRYRSSLWAYDPRVKNPLALGLVLLGSLAMVIATFLPLNESGTYRRIEDNTLIQHGGWMLIVLAIWIATAGYFVDQGRQQWALVFVPCILAAALVFLTGATAGTQTLYPVGPNGNPDTSQAGTTATMGIGIYLAGVAVAVAFTGALMLRKPASNPTPDAKPT